MLKNHLTAAVSYVKINSEAVQKTTGIKPTQEAFDSVASKTKTSTQIANISAFAINLIYGVGASAFAGIRAETTDIKRPE